MKKKIITAFILGMVVSSVVSVVASDIIPSSAVSYDDTTVASALDTLYSDVATINSGKSSIATALTNNGVSTASTASFSAMATNIGTLATNRYNAGVTATKKGTAKAAQVLTGYTFTNSSGVALSGTMANKGALNWKPTTSTTYTVPAGYYSGGTLDSSTVYTNGYNAGYSAATSVAEKYTTVLASTSQSNAEMITSYNIVNTNYVTATSTAGKYTVKKTGKYRINGYTQNNYSTLYYGTNTVNIAFNNYTDVTLTSGQTIYIIRPGLDTEYAFYGSYSIVYMGS